MATVTVLKSPSATGADALLRRVQQLQSEHLIKVLDAAVVSWPAGQRTPKTRQLVNMVAVGASTGMFWGMLFGAIFLTPLFGLAVGAVAGAAGGAFRDFGIDDTFINRLRSEVTEGTSALFLMTSDAVLDRVAAGLKPEPFELIATNLTTEQEQNLRAAFA